jgi:membrane dipeptidase
LSSFLVPHILSLLKSAEGIIDAYSSGRIASLIGVEGGHAMGNNLGLLRIMYDVGVRYMSLTHLCDTSW